MRSLVSVVLAAFLTLHPVVAAAAAFPEAARAPLAAYLSSPKAGSDRLIPALETLRRYAPPSADAPVVDMKLWAALYAKSQALRRAGELEGAGLAEAQAAHDQLRMLSRELAPWLPQAQIGIVESARQEAAATLERRYAETLESSANEALALTRAPLEPSSVDDSSRMSRTRVAGVVQPRTVEEIREALLKARALGFKVSVSGARHSQGGQIASEGSLHVNLDRFRDARFDPKTGLLTAQAGALWGDLQRLLDPHGKALDVTQVPNYFSVGGTLSVNAHGHNPDSGPAASTVESLKIMLADGSLVEASRQVNAELFRLALGGYGLPGLIVEAALRVRDNELYSFGFDRVPMKVFAAFHAKALAGDASSRYSHNLISIAPGSFLKEVVVTSYKAVPDPSRIPPPLKRTWRDGLERLVSDRLNALYRGPGWSKGLAWWLFSRVLYRFAQKEVTRNRVMSEPFTHFSNGSPDKTQILQEYFVPRARLDEFMERARGVLAEKPLPLVMVAVRAVKADPDSFLAHSPKDTFAVVFISDHPTLESEFERLDESTRGLIDAALSSGAKFYLPYRRVYSRETLDKAYPQMEEFFAAKRRYDPDELFSNKLYETYARPDARDANREYREAWDAAKKPLSPEQLERLRGYKVLFFKGLLADAYLKVGQQYFDASIKELRDQGIDAELAPTNAQASVEDNLAAASAAIAGSDKPVLIVSHSMGGLVTLHALLEKPELRAKVKGWAALQAPFGGSPVADWFAKHALWRWKLDRILALFGGDDGALRSLMTSGRSEYMARDPKAVLEVTQEVPVFSLATWKEKTSWWRQDSLLKLTRDRMLKTHGLKTDGLVGVDSAVLPGSDFAVVEGLDHAVPVMPSPVLPFDRPRFTRTVMGMLLARLAPPK
jgi:FAD/FMN-containing dehydrogenase